MARALESLARADAVPVDARRPMKYLSGHLPAAVNIPTYKLFAADGSLLTPRLLGELIGRAGVGDHTSPLIYDSAEGQNGAMLAWIFEFLGRHDVMVMDAFFESWKAAGHEVRYKPVERPAEVFNPQPDASSRVTLDELRESRGLTFVDFRSPAEYTGEQALGDDQPGHIPGAMNIEWRALGVGTERMLKSANDIARLLESAGVKRGQQLVAYCRSGPRAALGYLALKQSGYQARLFDGSFAAWSRSGLPVEK